MSGAKGGQNPNALNARRYSIYLKNVPPEKSNIVDVDGFFREFGDVLKIDLLPEKSALMVKFKEIASAERAAKFALEERNLIWGNPNVKLIYNVNGATQPRAPP